jgi:hypothetical protein
MKENKLRARWSKSENDILLTYPLGRMTKCDTSYLSFSVFTDKFVKEMKDRGYDIKTLKFEITVDKNGERYKDKFSTLAAEEGA